MSAVATICLVAMACAAPGQSPASATPQTSQPPASDPAGSANPSGQLDPNGPVVELTMMGQNTPTQRAYVVVEQPYFGSGGIVEDRSNGRVKFELFTASELGIGSQDLAATVRAGTVEIGFAGMLALGRDFPLATAGDIAGLYPDIETAKRATDALVPRLSELFEENQGLKILGSLAFSGDVFFCKDPIGGVADLAGKRIRTNGASVADLVDALGATNVTVQFVEVYQALQTGLVDCAITDRSSGNTQKWWEVASTLYDSPVTYAVGAYVVNLDTWNSLAPDVQAFLEATFAEVSQKQWELLPSLAEAGVACNTGDAANCPAELGTPATDPMTLASPTDADRATLRTLAEDQVIPKWLERCGSGSTTVEDCKAVFNETVGAELGITID